MALTLAVVYIQGTESWLTDGDHLTLIINHIAGEMHSHIKDISLVMDKFIYFSNKTTLKGYVKCESSKSSTPHFIFLDLMELMKGGFFPHCEGPPETPKSSQF